MTTPPPVSSAPPGNSNHPLTSHLSSGLFRLRKGAKVVLAMIFSLLGILSLIPALFWTFIYKWFTSIDVKSALMDYAQD